MAVQANYLRLWFFVIQRQSLKLCVYILKLEQRQTAITKLKMFHVNTESDLLKTNTMLLTSVSSSLHCVFICLITPSLSASCLIQTRCLVTPTATQLKYLSSCIPLTTEDQVYNKSWCESHGTWVTDVRCRSSRDDKSTFNFTMMSWRSATLKNILRTVYTIYDGRIRLSFISYLSRATKYHRSSHKIPH